MDFLRLKIKNLRFKKSKGFTLIEVLVSVFIFAMMIVVISQIYIAVLRTERVAYALLNSENNIRNNLEVIARSIRVGKNFTVSNNNKTISFDYFSEGSWDTMEYHFDGDEKQDQAKDAGQSGARQAGGQAGAKQAAHKEAQGQKGGHFQVYVAPLVIRPGGQDADGRHQHG